MFRLLEYRNAADLFWVLTLYSITLLSFNRFLVESLRFSTYTIDQLSEQQRKFIYFMTSAPSPNVMELVGGMLLFNLLTRTSLTKDGTHN